LQATIQTIYSFGDDPFVLKYVDDENDLCTISNQLELDSAVSHSPLRLKVTKKLDSNVTVQPNPCSQRVQFLKEKLATVETTLQTPDLPPHRLENLTKRKAILEWKLEKLQVPGSNPVFPFCAAARRDRCGRGPCEETPGPHCFRGQGQGPCEETLGPHCFRGQGRGRCWNKDQTIDDQTFSGPGCFRGRWGKCGQNPRGFVSADELPCDQNPAGPGYFRGCRGWWKKWQNEQKTNDDQPAEGPGCRGRGCWNKDKKGPNPQIQEMNKEIFALREVVRAKKIALHNAKQNGAPQSEVEPLFEEFVLARNNLGAKKLAKREIKDALMKARIETEAAERKSEDPQAVASTEEPVCQKKRCQNPELAQMQNEIVVLRQNLFRKKEALVQAKSSGAPKEEIERLFEDLVTARSNLREKKVAMRNCNDAWFRSPQTN